MTRLPALVTLAGGASSRMWPLREKSLLKFGAVSLLETQIQRYARIGFKKIIIVGNPDNRATMQSIAEKATSDQLAVHVAIQEEPRGMGDALLQTASFFQDAPDAPICVTQVHDVVEERLYQALLRAFQKHDSASYIAGVEMAEYFPGGYLIVDEGRITGIVEKPGAENQPGNLVNIVAHIHRNAAELFEAIRHEYATDSQTDDHYERAMDALMKRVEYRVVPYAGHWSALKYPWHVLDIMDYFLAQIQGQQVADSAFIAPTATLVGNVYIGEGAKIFPGAAVVGPAYVGAGTVVGNNALIRHSMVLDRCEVGYTTEVARSYVAEGCAMHACRVLDSVFAPHVNFSAGCTTANLRIDRGYVPSVIKGEKVITGRDKFGAVIGENAFLGVDVMTMPGVKIGMNAQVGPGTHVLRDVRDNSTVYVRQEQVVIED